MIDFYTYSHIHLGKGFASAAIGRDGDTLVCAISFCSPADQFSRKRGRGIARTRLFSLKADKYRFKLPAGVDNKNIRDRVWPYVLEILASDRYDRRDFPVWVEYAAAEIITRLGVKFVGNKSRIKTEGGVQ